MNAHPNVRWVQWDVTPSGFVLRCSVCGAEATAGNPAGADQFAAAHAEHRSAAAGHYGAGDAIAAATKAMGVETCTPCEARRRQLNGWFPRVWKR